MNRRSRSKHPTRLRYVPESSYARGAATRARLIEAAIGVFGERGFEAASTRDIASAASLNTPALQYYFDNKEGLYAACAEQLVAQAWAAMRDVVIEAERALARRAADEGLIAVFAAYHERLLDLLGNGAGDWLLWMAREQTAPGSGPGFLAGRPKSRRMLDVSLGLVARLLRRPAKDAQTIVHELVLGGMCTQFWHTRRRAFALLGWTTFDTESLALIKRVTLLQSQAALRAAVAARNALRRPAATARSADKLQRSGKARLRADKLRTARKPRLLARKPGSSDDARSIGRRKRPRQ